MTWIFRLIVLSVMLSMVYMLLPEKGLKSVLGGIMGIILLLNLIQPIGRFINGNSLPRIGDVILENIVNQEDNLHNEIIIQYKEKCVQAIQAYTLDLETVSVCRAEVLIEEDPESDSFGTLQHVYLYVEFGEEKHSESWIPPIVILPPSESSDREKTEKIKDIQSNVASWLQIDLSCVTVFEEGRDGKI